MAFLIPDNLRSRKDVSEAIRRVASAFQTGLDEDVTVWFEPLFDPNSERPHLVVLEPRVGVLVLEVLKGKGKGRLLGALRGKLWLEIDGEEREVDNPLERAEQLAHKLRTAMDGSTGLPGKVPVGAIAVFSGISRSEAEDLGIGRVLNLDHCIFRPDLDSAINEGNGAGLLRVFQRSTDSPMESELDDSALTLLRGLIHPDVVITGDQSQGSLFVPSALDGDLVKVMDRRQEALAKGLGSGHRVIRGVAGSGKTLVLVYRARLLASLLPSKRILVTCYTRALASQLRVQLADFPNVEVVHLDKLMSDALRKAGMKHPGYAGGDSGPVIRAALDAIRSQGGPKYRAVMVDEAQDFDTEALRFCVELLEATEPDEQDLIIVADSAQNIFRKNFRWKDAGIKAQGRTRLLRVNYRNTKEILEFAHDFLLADPDISADEAPDPEDNLTIIPAEAAERSGPAPEVVVAEDIDAQVQAVVEHVKAHSPSSALARSIAVLHTENTNARENWGARINTALEDAGVPVFWVTDAANKANRDNAGSAIEPVILSTIHSAKGLEFPHVIVCGLGPVDDLTTRRKLLYVGFTRAVDTLTVVAGRDSPFLPDLGLAALSESPV